MKTLKFGLIGILLVSTSFLSTQLHANNIIEPTAVELRAALSKMVQNPKLKENGIAEGNVSVSFTLSPKGEIQIVNIDADSEYLSEFVRKKLDSQKVDLPNSRLDKVYYLTLFFELL